MRHLSRWALVGLTSTFAMSSWAATLVERQDAQGKTEKLTVSEDYARVDTSRREVYTLMDFKQNKMFLIHPQKKQIVERNLKSSTTPPEGMPLPPETPVGEVKLEDKGEGPEIAGYTTQHYQITADGEVCADSYLSAAAAEVSHLKHFLKAMEELSMPPEAMITRMPPCAQAQYKLKSDFFDKGLPLRSVNKEGKTVYEITSIKTDVEMPADTFKLPDGYEVLNEADMRKKMEEMMRQHQGEGKMLPPEMMQQRGEEHKMMPPPGMHPNIPPQQPPQDSNATD